MTGSLEIKIDTTNSIHKTTIHSTVFGCEVATINPYLRDRNEWASFLSAAPELYEVCELVLQEWEKDTAGIQRGELIARLTNYADLARAAINKAKGKIK